MKLVITENYEQGARLAAREMLKVVKENPGALLGLATGTTPIPVYRHMGEAAKSGKVDFSQVRTINLDEYLGVEAENPNSYCYFMRSHLLDACGITMDRVMIPDGMGNIEEELMRMNAFADANPIDVQFLSVGVNGHIGFNEPSRVFHDKYHKVTLTEKTRESNSRLFPSIEDVPKAAITMGVGGIMRARKIIFLATGREKLNAMRAILEDGDVTPENQGTVLKFHQDCTVFLEQELADQIVPAPYIDVSYAQQD